MTDYRISELIKENAKVAPDRIGVIQPGGINASYRDFMTIYSKTRDCFREFGVQDFDRMVLVSGNPLHRVLFSLPVMEGAVLATFDLDKPRNELMAYTRLLRLSYILTDDLGHDMVGIAGELGLGIIVFDLSGGTHSLDCRLAKTRDNRAQSMAQNSKDKELFTTSTTSGTSSDPKRSRRPMKMNGTAI
jgi:long-subunit acyl-CoA synthetase (AMP-forming)